MKRIFVKDALDSDRAQESVLIRGWVRTRRDSKEFSFMELNDGSCLKNIQVVVDATAQGYDQIKTFAVGSSAEVEGALVESPGKGQRWEVKADRIGLIGSADQETYPLQKKRHSDEFLRTMAHLRPRTNKFAAVFRIRSETSYAIHKYFRDRGYYYVHTPIITGSDCEGAGSMFQLSTAADNPKAAAVEFFGKEANLTVSGQLEAELFAHALGAVYTFGPTFRAENSNTPRHAAEFWMIEPEVAFADLNDNMDLGEDMTKEVIRRVLAHCPDDVELFAKWVDKTLMDTLNNILDNDFVRLPYREAVEILAKVNDKFDFPVEFGSDLQTEHERFLTETHFKKPVIVYNYPKTIKPFYMRLNDDDETVAAMDVLVPRIGELIGGSQREERLDVLERRMGEMDMDLDEYWWYRDIRRWGSTPHAGFGLGFERLLMLITGVTNIRDVIPFPRTPKNLEF